jgi:hypothetical protein
MDGASRQHFMITLNSLTSETKIDSCLLKEIIFSLARVMNIFETQRIFENLTKVA